MFDIEVVENATRVANINPESVYEKVIAQMLVEYLEYCKTNLTPQQINEINKLYLEKCQEVNQLKAEIEQLKDRLKIKDNNFELYCDLVDENEKLHERLGKSIELPCKIGDILYCTRMGEIKEYKVFAINIGLRENTKSCVILTKTTRGSTVDFELIDFGKIAFLTYEDAEKALAERQVSE